MSILLSDIHYFEFLDEIYYTLNPFIDVLIVFIELVYFGHQIVLVQMVQLVLFFKLLQKRTILYFFSKMLDRIVPVHNTNHGFYKIDLPEHYFLLTLHPNQLFINILLL